MNQPLFSIVIPTYQSERTIHACLTSVLTQSYRNFEVIVQDGHSTDRTLEIIRSFDDPRVRVFSEKDGGVYDAMNRALAHITGRWIFFLGSDDRLYEPSTLADLMDVAEQSSADLIYGNVLMSGSNQWLRDGEIYRGKTDLATLFVKNLSHQAIIYHKKIFDNGFRYNLDYRVCADFDLNLFCFAHYKVAYTPLIVAVFAIGGLSTTGEGDERFEADKWANIVRYYKGRLMNPTLADSKSIFRKTGKQLICQGEFSAGITALTVYLYLEIVSLWKK